MPPDHEFFVARFLAVPLRCHLSSITLEGAEKETFRANLESLGPAGNQNVRRFGEAS